MRQMFIFLNGNIPTQCKFIDGVVATESSATVTNVVTSGTNDGITPQHGTISGAST